MKGRSVKGYALRYPGWLSVSSGTYRTTLYGMFPTRERAEQRCKQVERNDLIRTIREVSS